MKRLSEGGKQGGRRRAGKNEGEERGNGEAGRKDLNAQ